MSRPVVLLGAGGHARVVADLLDVLGRTVLGFVTPDEEAPGIPGHPRLGGDEVLTGYEPGEIWVANGVGSTGRPSTRRLLYERWQGRGFAFDILVHPAAAVSPRAELGAGCQVMAGAVVQVGTRTGENVIINTRASVDHDCVLGNHCHIAPGATLSGGVEVGEGSHVGAGATVLQGVRIGRGVVVGAGAVVIEDIEDDATVVGIPARMIGR